MATLSSPMNRLSVASSPLNGSLNSPKNKNILLSSTNALHQMNCSDDVTPLYEAIGNSEWQKAASIINAQIQKQTPKSPYTPKSGRNNRSFSWDDQGDNNENNNDNARGMWANHLTVTPKSTTHAHRQTRQQATVGFPPMSPRQTGRTSTPRTKARTHQTAETRQDDESGRWSHSLQSGSTSNSNNTSYSSQLTQQLVAMAEMERREGVERVESSPRGDNGRRESPRVEKSPSNALLLEEIARLRAEKERAEADLAKAKGGHHGGMMGLSELTPIGEDEMSRLTTDEHTLQEENLSIAEPCPEWKSALDELEAEIRHPKESAAAHNHAVSDNSITSTISSGLDSSVLKIQYENSVKEANDLRKFSVAMRKEHNETISELESELERERAEKVKIMSNVVTLEYRISTLEEELEAALSDKSKSENAAKLEADLEKESSKNDKLQSRISTLEEDLEEAMSRKKYGGDIDRMAFEMHQLKKKLNAKQEEAEKSKELLDAAKVELRVAEKVKERTIQEKEDECNEKIRQLKLEYEQKLKDKEESFHEEMREIEALQQDIEDSECASEGNALEAKLSECQKDMKSQRRQHRSEMNKMKNTLEMQKSKEARLEGHIKTLEKQIMDMTAEYEERIQEYLYGKMDTE